MLGIASGCIVHVFAAAIGLSALLAASSAAFTLLKWTGAAYLCYIGVTMLLSRAQTPSSARAIDIGTTSNSRVFWQGALTNILNPKVALFFLAFLPQFVDAESNHKPFAFLTLGLIFIFTGTVWCVGVALFAAKVAGRVRQSGRVLLWFNRALGGTFVYLGARIALLQAR